jgi:hypothetical protein
MTADKISLDYMAIDKGSFTPKSDFAFGLQVY